MITIKIHPLMFFKYLYSFLFVAIIPIGRNIVSLVTHKEYERLLNLETAAMVFVVVFSAIKKRYLKIIIKNGKLYIKEGVFLRRETVVDTKKILAVCYTVNPIQAAFSAVRVTFKYQDSRERSFIIYKNETRKLNSALSLYKTPNFSTLGAKRTILFAAATSSAAVGLLLAAPAVNRAGKLLGAPIAEKFLGTINQTAQALSALISPLASVVSLIFLCAYLLSFINNLFKSVFMRTGASRDNIFISSGILPRKILLIKRGIIGCIAVESNPLLRVFSRWQVRFSVPDNKNSQLGGAVFMPSVKKGEAKKFLASYFWFSPERELKAPHGSAFRFIRWYIFSVGLIFPITFLLVLFFSDFSEFFMFLAVVFSAVLLYAVNLGFYNYKNGALQFFRNRLLAKSVKHFKRREVLFYSAHISMLKIRRYPTDIRGGTCILTVCLQSKTGESAKVKFINYKKAKEYIGKLWEG